MWRALTIGLQKKTDKSQYSSKKFKLQNDYTAKNDYIAYSNLDMLQTCSAAALFLHLSPEEIKLSLLASKHACLFNASPATLASFTAVVAALRWDPRGSSASRKLSST